LTPDPELPRPAIPAGWPPDDQNTGRTAAVFPLRDVFLFPGQLLPLHVFEPRYRQMVEDALDGPGHLVMAAPCEDQPPLPQGPRLPDVSGLGEIVKHHRLADGRFLIWILGLGRVRIAEVESDRLYRRVRYEVVEEVGPTRSEVAELYAPLHSAILARMGNAVRIPESVTTGQLADILGQCLQLPGTLMAHVFAETRVTERARMVLAAHGKFPPRRQR
jgi:Lon protease-like protein